LHSPQLLEGVSLLHARCIFHGDIKLGNILLRRNPDGSVTVALTDFGGSRVADANGHVVFDS
jgi:serine/threonine protein kinase